MKNSACQKQLLVSLNGYRPLTFATLVKIEKTQIKHKGSRRLYRKIPIVLFVTHQIPCCPWSSHCTTKVFQVLRLVSSCSHCDLSKSEPCLKKGLVSSNLLCSSPQTPYNAWRSLDNLTIESLCEQPCSTCMCQATSSCWRTEKYIACLLC
jgi:hypothetical protein